MPPTSGTSTTGGSDIDVLGISGSLRQGSYNTLLVRAACHLAPDGMTIRTYQGMRDLPHYDQDLDADPTPEPVVRLREEIHRADGLLIITPEYNYSIPGSLKNLIDWASRPYDAAALTGKPAAIATAAPTNFGGLRAQLALRQIFLWTGTEVVSKPEVTVTEVHGCFDDRGNLTDGDVTHLVTELLEGLAAKIRKGRAATLTP
ncbi:MAG: NADPH-dependent FMN reductase [Mycobacteriales bacterium]